MALGVTVDFNANLVKFEGQMNKMAGQLDKFQNKTETMAARANKALSSMGVGISVAGLAAFVKSGIDAADALNDMADRTGVAVEKLAGLQLAAKLADTDMDAVSASINKLSVNIGKSAEDFKALGITAKDPVEAFLQLADIYRSIDDPQQRAALGAKALGKSYAEMATLLMQGSDALREQIDQGQKMSGITTEQAKAAADFNDKLDTLNQRISTLSVSVSGPAVSALLAYGDAIAFAAQQADGFHPFKFLDAAGFAASGDSGKLAYLNKQIAETGEAISKVQNQGPVGSLIDAVLGSNIEELDSKMISLNKQRDALLKPPASNASIIPPTSQAALQKFIGSTEAATTATKSHAAAHKSAASSHAQHSDAIAKTIENLQFEISILGQSSEQQRKLNEIRSSTVGATDAQAEAIKRLINQKYNLIEADEIIADGERLAAQQRSDAAGEYQRLTDMFSGENQSKNQLYDDAFQAKNMGVINDAGLKSALENISQGYDVVTGKAQESSNQMSEFSIQAARNMQSAFADFLFNPFDKGLAGMGDAFLKTLQRMAADAASAQVMETLFGAGKSGDGGLLKIVLGAVAGGLGSAAGGAGAGAIGGATAFASGGIVSSPTYFGMAGGKRGLMGESGAEAILPLKRDKSGNLGVVNSGGGDVQISTTVNVNGKSSGDKDMQALGVMINSKIRQVIVTEKRPGGLLA